MQLFTTLISFIQKMFKFFHDYHQYLRNTLMHVWPALLLENNFLEKHIPKHGTKTWILPGFLPWLCKKFFKSSYSEHNNPWHSYHVRNSNFYYIPKRSFVCQWNDRFYPTFIQFQTFLWLQPVNKHSNI